MAYVSGARISTLSFRTRLAEIKAQFAEARRARKIYRQTLAELQGYSDRELADLGMTRSMIKAVAFDAAYGKAPR
ncbi:MAG: DUF1127 domain-containing protein [Rhodobacteraceae bacterium]|nr:DUF1127 domain-containing protein [Paracoccaceae bacterium]